MERFNRAVRRHHIARLKQKRKHYWGYGRRVEHGESSMNAMQLGKVVQYPQVCSCGGCGNARRWPWMNEAEHTLQERRYFDQYREQLDELID